MLKNNQTISKDDLVDSITLNQKLLLDKISKYRNENVNSIFSGIDSEMSNVINLELQGTVFELLYIPHQKRTRKLYVGLSAGGRSEPKTQFQAWSWCRFLDGDMLCIEDPTYKKLLGSDQKRTVTGWYFGDEDTSYLMLLSDFLKNLKEKAGYESVIFMGTSAGGYAGLYLANEIDGSTAVVCCPQTILSKWHQYPWYPEIHPLENIDKFGRFNIKRITENKKSKFVILFNSKNSYDVAQINNIQNKESSEPVSVVGNILILRGNSICQPTHHFLYDHTNFSVFVLLAELFSKYGGDDARVKALANNLVHQVNSKYDLTLLQATNTLRNLISEKFIKNSVRTFKTYVNADHVNICFEQYGREYRYDIGVSDTIQERCNFGFHVNKSVLTGPLREGLQKIAQQHGLRIGENELIFILTKTAHKYNVVVDELYDLIQKTSADISRLIDANSVNKIQTNKGVNQIFRVLKNGSEELVDKIPGVDIVFHGLGNTVKIHETFKAGNLRLSLGNSCSVIIEERANCTNSYIDANADNIKVRIGKGVAFYNAEIFAAGEPNLEVSIGDETIFAIGVVIWVNDRHAIYDISSGKVLNKPKSGVKIGKHVWLGQEVFIMKDVEIPDGCIVGARSLVTSSSGFKENSVVAGVPARTIRTNVAWDIRTVNEFEKQH